MGDSDLIEKCCKWCPFEIILRPNQRTNGILKNPLKKKHPTRELIEQICGNHYDEVCGMKYAIMRTELSDFNLVQLGLVIKPFKLDYGKKIRKKPEIEKTFLFWTENKDLGRGFEESYASRFREIWELGLREYPGKDEPHQSFAGTFIYEMVVSSNPEMYNSSIKLFENLKKEYHQRDKTGIKH